jgi:hypothetical protein
MLWDLVRLSFATTIVSVAAFGAGQLLQPLLPENFSTLDRLACTWLLGFGVLSAVLFLVGQIAFTRTIICLVLAAGVLAGLRAIFNLARRIADLWRTHRIPWIPAAVIAAVLVLTAVAGIADIAGGLGHDGVAYHLLAPKVWLRDGIIRPLPDSSHTAFPASGEVIFGALQLLGGPHAPGFAAAWIFAVFLLVVASIAGRAGVKPIDTWWPAAFVASMPAVYSGAHSGFVDVLYAAFVLAAARVAIDADRRRDFLAFGIFCGLAAATKYTGLLAIPALLITAILSRERERTGTRRALASNIALAVGVAAIVAAPVYLRNWILLGCPIYPPPPGLSEFFHVKYLSDEAVRHFHEYIRQRGAGLGRGPAAFLLLPYNLTYHTSNFHGAGGIGLYALALGPIGLIANWKHAFVRALTILGILLTIEWFVTQQESRFLIHVYVISAVFAMLGWSYVKSVSPRRGAALSAIAIGCSLAYGLFMIGSARAGDVAAVFSPQRAERRRQARTPYLDAFRFLNNDRSVHRVLILDASVPAYYLDKNYVKIRGQWGEQPLANVNDAREAIRQVKELNVSHVLDVKSESSDFQVPTASTGLALVFERPDARIYRVE